MRSEADLCVSAPTVFGIAIKLHFNL